MVEFREATPADASAIVLVASWLAAYSDLLPDEVLASLSISDREQFWSGALTARPPQTGAVVATLAGTIVGFTATGPPLVPADRADPKLGDLYALYLHPDVWDRGIGTQLHATALDQIRSCGFTHAGLRVLDPTNEPCASTYATVWTDTGPLVVASANPAPLLPGGRICYEPPT